ncbi:Rieske 2Fe-2S domain-containing protein [Bradyrhizobium sp. 31Argb]|uniref:Rieske 2Fe-2S domain-containing protein n=1 Tax=Bradyrhizobium sp. 31Argb TaxID=3141247 RepID=UPI0037479AAD
MTKDVLIGRLDEFPPGEVRQATLPDGTNIAVYNVDGAIYATADLCTHGEASLSEEGILTGKIVECPWHFGTFDVTKWAADRHALHGRAEDLPGQTERRGRLCRMLTRRSQKGAEARRPCPARRRGNGCNRAETAPANRNTPPNEPRRSAAKRRRPN